MTIRTYLIVASMEWQHGMRRSPISLTRKVQGLVIRGGGPLNRNTSLSRRVEGGRRLKATFMSHIKHDSLKATYLSGGRHLWMIKSVEGEKEARYCDVRQDEIWGWGTRGRRWESIKAKLRTLTNHPLTQRSICLNPGTPQTYCHPDID